MYIQSVQKTRKTSMDNVHGCGKGFQTLGKPIDVEKDSHRLSVSRLYR